VRPTKENGAILKEYVKLTRKLGKFPSAHETTRFITSERQVKNHFGSFKALKELALETHPELKDVIIPAKLTFNDLNDYKLELEKKKIDKKNKAVLDNLLTVDTVSRFVDQIDFKQVKPHHPPSYKEPITRALNLTLSDLHFGADIKAEETGFLAYGAKEESRRFAEIIKQTIEYKPHYRKQTELYVNLLGDIIQHKLHDPQDAAPVSEQICRAIHLLIQGFAQLAENFGKVVVYCATGNHGRDLNRHRDRATSGKWDSLETIIYYSIKKSLKKYKNLEFIIPKTPYVVYDVLGHKIFATHGDNVIKSGNPGKSLNIASMENQINRINASMDDMDEIKVAIVGHTHCASVSNLNSGAVMVTNGALPPVDQYTVSIGFLENRASQTIFEMTKEHALGDIRFIRVGKEQDSNKTLDKIIKPFEGFEE